MALTGFVQRFKGKIDIKDYVLTGGTQTARSVALYSSALYSPNFGIINLSSATTAAANVTLAAPFAGATVSIWTTAASTGFRIECSTAATVGVGPSTNIAIILGSSTAGVVNCGIELIGISTAMWGVIGTFGTVAYATA